MRFGRGRRRSWEPIASYQCCIIFRTGTYFPIQTTTRSKIGPGGRQGIKLILRYALTKSKFWFSMIPPRTRGDNVPSSVSPNSIVVDLVVVVDLVSRRTSVLWPWRNSLAAVCRQKCTYRKNPEAEKLDGNQWEIKLPIDYRRVFFDCGFFFPGWTFTGKLLVSTSTIQFLWWGLQIQAFLGPGLGAVLILSEFI